MPNAAGFGFFCIRVSRSQYRFEQSYRLEPRFV